MMEQNTENVQPAVDLDSDDWESTVLRRVARRVEALPATPPEADDFGWEEGVLENLRKRLAANE
jgi:hypothetical protein